MPAPEDFGLDLGTRIAVHEMLLQKLYAKLAREHHDPKRVLADIETSLVNSFDFECLRDGAALTPSQEEMVRVQSEYGKELSKRFVAKVLGFVE